MSRLFTTAAIAGLLLAAGPASAQMFGVAAVADDTLGTVAGKADLEQSVRADNRATVSNNRVIGNSVTGVISIDGNAFQNLNGLAIVSANTGNNVVINASLNVNVAIQP